MLKRVKRIKLVKQARRRLMERLLERDGWRCQRCDPLRTCKFTTRFGGASRATTLWRIS